MQTNDRFNKLKSKKNVPKSLSSAVFKKEEYPSKGGLALNALQINIYLI